MQQDLLYKYHNVFSIHNLSLSSFIVGDKKLRNSLNLRRETENVQKTWELRLQMQGLRPNDLFFPSFFFACQF